MVYANLQLEIEDPHENHFEVNRASSLNICFIITTTTIKSYKLTPKRKSIHSILDNLILYSFLIFLE